MSDSQEIKKRTLSAIKKTNTVDLSSYEFGKLPPQAQDLERAVLGAILIDSQCIDIVLEILSQPDFFYSDAHQRIYKSILTLYQTEKPIDLLTLTEQLRFEGNLDKVGGAYYVTQLTNAVASSANAEFYARIVAQKFIQRELIHTSSIIIKEAYEDTTDVFELLDKAESNLFNISQSNKKKSSIELSNLLMPQLEEIKKRMEDNKQGKTLTGVGSGFTELDRMTSGWQPSDLVIVAGRPAMGKTAFTLALMRNAAVDFQKPVVFFSLEMSAAQLVQRLISMEAELPAEKLKKGDLRQDEWMQLITKIDKLETAPIIIDDTPALSIFELRAKCRRMARKSGLSMVIIDYLQLMSGASPDGKTNGNREQEISSISRALKGLAKELNVPVIALSQLSRAPESRTGTKKPQLSDLRESGAIEQDADMVLFLYRPEYYGLTVDEDNNDVRGVAEVIIAKHRNGSVGTVRTRFVSHLAKFTDLDQSAAFGDFSIHTPPVQPPSGFISKSSRMNEVDDDDFQVPF